MEKKQGKVTLSCRVLPEQKLELAEKAKGLGLSTCQYVEALVLKNHQSLINDSDEEIEEIDGEVIDSDEELEEIDSEMNDRRSEFYFEDLIYGKYLKIYSRLVDELIERYPNTSEAELVVACVLHVKQNEKAWIQRGYDYFLKRVSDGRYDYLIPKNEDDDN